MQGPWAQWALHASLMPSGSLTDTRRHPGVLTGPCAGSGGQAAAAPCANPVTCYLVKLASGSAEAQVPFVPPRLAWQTPH